MGSPSLLRASVSTTCFFYHPPPPPPSFRVSSHFPPRSFFLFVPSPLFLPLPSSILDHSAPSDLHSAPSAFFSSSPSPKLFSGLLKPQYFHYEKAIEALKKHSGRITRSTDLQKIKVSLFVVVRGLMRCVRIYPHPSPPQTSDSRLQRTTQRKHSKVFGRCDSWNCSCPMPPPHCTSTQESTVQAGT
jgi:hypothetical protein